jgi:hypothetical protein
VTISPGKLAENEAPLEQKRKGNKAKQRARKGQNRARHTNLQGARQIHEKRPIGKGDNGTTYKRYGWPYLSVVLQRIQKGHDIQSRCSGFAPSATLKGTGAPEVSACSAAARRGDRSMPCLPATKASPCASRAGPHVPCGPWQDFEQRIARPPRTRPQWPPAPHDVRLDPETNGSGNGRSSLECQTHRKSPIFTVRLEARATSAPKPLIIARCPCTLRRGYICQDNIAKRMTWPGSQGEPVKSLMIDN